jgi:hypothetical protein
MAPPRIPTCSCLDRVFVWLEEAREAADPKPVNAVAEPALIGLHEDPRWLHFLRSIGQSPEPLATIPFKVTLPPWAAHPSSV